MRYPKISTFQLRGNTGTTTAASCSDAATHTKEILIAPLDGNLQSVEGKTAAFAWNASKQILVSVVQVRRCDGGATLTHFVREKWVFRLSCMDKERRKSARRRRNRAVCVCEGGGVRLLHTQVSLDPYAVSELSVLHACCSFPCCSSRFCCMSCLSWSACLGCRYHPGDKQVTSS